MVTNLSVKETVDEILFQNTFFFVILGILLYAFASFILT